MAVLGLEEVRDEDDHGGDRIVRWHPRKGITCEADPRHAEILRRDTGAQKPKTISTLAAKETGTKNRRRDQH